MIFARSCGAIVTILFGGLWRSAGEESTNLRDRTCAAAEATEYPDGTYP